VPNLSGLDQAVASDTASRRGLLLAIVGEEYSDTVPAGQVVSQSPEPDARVKPGSTVEVTLSKGSAGVEVPNVVGMPLSDAETTLADLALNSARIDQWSPQALGTVLSQSPDPGSFVAPGDVVTLTVSAGRELAVGARIGDVARLLAVAPSADRLRPGETLTVMLRWQSLRQGSERYSVFMHFAGAAGQVVAQDDGEPRDGQRPTSSWAANEIITEERSITVPKDASPGVYTIRVGMYTPPSGPRLPVGDAGRTPVQDDALLVISVWVVQ
jgi:hypothetical protein